MSRIREKHAHSAYAKMLGNIASDLDTLLTDLCRDKKDKHPSPENKHPSPGNKHPSPGDNHPSTTETPHSADTLGKDSFLSSAGDTSRRQAGTTCSDHSVISSSDQDHNDLESVDSGHGGHCRSGPSPLVFDPHHFGSESGQVAPSLTEGEELTGSMDELRPISTLERLIKTNSIWLLATMSRAGAVHILKDKETGIFIVRKSSQPNSLALSVQSRLSDHSTVDHYLIEGTNYGFSLQGSAHYFHSIPALIAYYIENVDEIPYHLKLPSALQQARSTRELASLDMLGQDFWISNLSRKQTCPGILAQVMHKSSSEPVNIQLPQHTASPHGHAAHNTVPSKLASEFSHFMNRGAEIEQNLHQHLCSTESRGINQTALIRQNHSKVDVSLINLSLTTKTPPPGGTDVTADSCLDTTGSCEGTSKRVIESSVIKDQPVFMSKPENSQMVTSNTQLTNHSESSSARVPASHPHASKNLSSGTISCREQNADIYLANPSNVPAQAVRKDLLSAAQLSHQSVAKDSSSLTQLLISRETSTKERAWTHPGSVPKLQSNLYFTTNLDLLEMPENSYFTSSLSDKLSDYEDIWRSSCCESDVDRKNLKMICDPRAILDARMSSAHKKHVTEGKKKVFRKTSKDSLHARRSVVPASRDAVTGGSTGLTALEQARLIAGSTSEDEPVVPVAHIRGIRRMEDMFEEELSCQQESLLMPKQISDNSEKTVSGVQFSCQLGLKLACSTSHKFTEISKQDVEGMRLPAESVQADAGPHELTAKNVVTSSTPMSVHHSAASSDTSGDKARHKSCLKPVLHLSRIKSSSESSLATVSSPLYAEPADAVKLRDKNGMAINIQVRRRSAPLATCLQMKEKFRGDQQMKKSQQPPLDTIFSPDALNVTQDSSSKFVFDSCSSTAEVNSSLAVHLGVSRSLSMKTTNELSQLQAKQSWKDRLNRLKLGTKVLSHNVIPPTSSGFRTNLVCDLESTEMNSSVFQSQPLAHTSSALCRSCPGKFPVSHQHEFNRVSGFSESSTVQDLISCAHPELSVRPITAKFRRPEEKTGGAPPSEYDNLMVYRASTHSSMGTVYSPPWETGTAHRLIRESPILPPQILPPAMDIVERIERWQQASSSYHGVGVDSPLIQGGQNLLDQPHPDPDRLPQSNQQRLTIDQKQIQSSKPASKQIHTSNESLPSQQLKSKLLQQQQSAQSPHPKHLEWNQQQQLLEHQRQIKSDDRHSPQGFHSLVSTGVLQQHNLQKHTDINDAAAGKVPVRNKSADSRSNVISPSPTNNSFTMTCSPQCEQPTTTSINRLSSHCPDVVNCHNTSASQQPIRSSDPVTDPLSSLPASDQGGLHLGSQQGDGRNKSWSNGKLKTPGSKIKDYIFKLSSDRQTIFGSTIENFIQCTMESQETNPQYVMRNVRQFMTGIKNYLVKHGEGELESLIERERNKLGVNEILNIDAIIEQALHVCVLKPLKYHIYRLFVEKYSRNGALEQLSRNIKYARTKSAQDLGVKAGLKLPQDVDLAIIKHYLDLMQKSYSPLQKLQNLLKATSTIYYSVQRNNSDCPGKSSSLGAEDFLPVLIYVIVHCGLVSAEVEADFMWGLLQPSLLTGEGGYYLTTLSSAVLILKNFQETHQLAPAQVEGKLPTLSDMQGFLKVAIPDELHGSITWKTLPVRPNMTTKEVCAMVAHKFRITNPQDFGLYLLCNGMESLLTDTDCPQIIKGDKMAVGRFCFFAFKRLDANIAWPKHLKHPSD